MPIHVRTRNGGRSYSLRVKHPTESGRQRFNANSGRKKSGQSSYSRPRREPKKLGKKAQMSS